MTTLPPDSHAHSQFSWDAHFVGDMERACAEAVRIGLPSIAFTEHADFSPAELDTTDPVPEQWAPFIEGTTLQPPPIDLTGYHESIERCRERFPELRILTGVELSEPHWHPDATADLLGRGRFQRVLASMHAVSRRDEPYLDSWPGMRFATDPVEVVRGYLREALRLVEEFDDFEVLTHVDYPLRYQSPDQKPVDVGDLEDEYRELLRALARAGKVMEFNTRIPLDRRVIGWWREEGGGAVSFASDAHIPDKVAWGFKEAAAVARAAGFRPDDDPLGFWVRD
jgi:histidinol-phosphatase (PHP family)